MNHDLDAMVDFVDSKEMLDTEERQKYVFLLPFRVLPEAQMLIENQLHV